LVDLVAVLTPARAFGATRLHGLQEAAACVCQAHQLFLPRPGIFY
jgi:hypothetical protein